MKKFSPLLAVAAVAFVAGCNNSDHTIVAGGPNEHDPEAAALEANGPVTLPAAITASKTYRCADNSLLYIDWLSDGGARVKTEKAGAATSIPAGEGSPLKGSSSAASISYNGKSCKA